MNKCELCGCRTSQETLCPTCRTDYVFLGDLIMLLGNNVRVSFEKDEDTPWVVRVYDPHDKLGTVYQESGEILSDVIELILIKKRGDK